ncbi:MAG: hypothetical protein VB135_02930 [Burkholderia sp.]
MANSRVPDPDPQETFDNVTEQIFGPMPAAGADAWLRAELRNHRYEGRVG